MGNETYQLKSLIFMLANRVERLEKKIDALDDEKRAHQKNKFNEDMDFFKTELKRLDDLI
ncbi:hypothetical protein [Alkalihalophilus marmarensis]|uniref:hypothetical protein n=1 Tax=Alkalihalophilus marmarensis TaxID=521377 RepID=UPI002E1C8709|nr:hypothetical protein [Alkalihalophilus marmarensis]